ncbi:MAG: histidine kinase [Chloroherpetonaceae bacterium]|nr:histidine kinase [Chloroherpetonaceae bacterium]
MFEKKENQDRVERESDPSSHFLLFPRTGRQWLIAVFVMLSIAILANGSINLIKWIYGVTDDTDPMWKGFLMSIEYTVILSMMQLITGELASKYFPLRNRIHVIYHILIQILSTVVSIYIAREIEIIFIGSCVLPAEVFTAVMSVSVIFSIIGNSVYYLIYFYREAKDARQRALESELKALRAQINPHFLFNTLNSISALITLKPEVAESVTQNLADLFRYSLRSSKHPLVSLKDEIDSVHLYLDIEKVRFGERLRSSVIVDQDLENALVPSLILQPLVENSVKHGANKTEGQFFIHLTVLKKDSEIEIIVHDSGEGFDLTSNIDYFSKGTGLQNVRERLRLTYKGEARFHLEKNAVILNFPFIEISSTSPELISTLKSTPL